MTCERRKILLAGLAGTALWTGGARAQAFPSRPIRLVVGYPAGILGPKGIPPPVVERLASALGLATSSAVFKECIKAVGAVVARPGRPEEVDAYLRTEVAKWAPIVKATGARAD